MSSFSRLKKLIFMPTSKVNKYLSFLLTIFIFSFLMPFGYSFFNFVFFNLNLIGSFIFTVFLLGFFLFFYESLQVFLKVLKI